MQNNWSETELKRAHKHSIYHHQQIKNSRCGCFYCLKTFEYSDIHEWTDNDTTALCPICGIDTVIGDTSGFPIHQEFLQAMHKYYF